MIFFSAGGTKTPEAFGQRMSLRKGYTVLVSDTKAHRRFNPWLPPKADTGVKPDYLKYIEVTTC